MTKRVLDSTRESAYKGVIAVSLTATLLSAVFLVTVLPMISEFAEMNIDSLKSDAIYCGASSSELSSLLMRFGIQRVNSTGRRRRSANDYEDYETEDEKVCK
ncbi:unnamed protein product [Nippostrongylus brasiliensis]|uniref:Col_cuticle_N domain-containing protein n=1 Tax=Nippostrongylus brasiliensis TaxID=27835 RepID=A0A0N4YXK2_NIPBR|nr:unnamed protein product [Nippostrongylus brasiliensis]